MDVERKYQIAPNDSHLEAIFDEYLLPEKINPVKDPKVIHDPLWGSCLFYPWEIMLIDTPLLQRLRGIHQLGTAFYTYPSGIHTRFSHTLGVTILADRLINRLKEKLTLAQNDSIKISTKDIFTVRLAGLLHDVGHCFFSHASENILEKYCDFGEIFDIKAKFHEKLSYLIVTHDIFKKFFREHIEQLFPRKKDTPDLCDVANIIIGKPPSPEKRFLQEIISGPYDVDKLEYLYRDARTAGLENTYDIERYFYKITLHKAKDGNIRLVMTQGGVQAVEQIIFCKMMLFSFLYHHHKVLAADSVFIDVFRELLSINDKKYPIQIKHPLDCLRYNDHDILGLSLKPKNKNFKHLREKLLFRSLPKRCFVINREFIEGLETDIAKKEAYKKLKKEMQNQDGDMRTELAKKIGCDQYSLFVSCPNLPKMEEISSGPILNSKKELEPISRYFQLEGWQNSYELKKLRAYFFVDQDFLAKAADVIESYIKEKYGLTFSEQAKSEAKLLK